MEDEFDKRELETILRAVMNDLDERRRYVIECLYGFNEREIKSMAEIGRSLGVSYQMVQSLHKSSIRRIRKNKNVLGRLKPFW